MTIKVAPRFSLWLNSRITKSDDESPHTLFWQTASSTCKAKEYSRSDRLTSGWTNRPAVRHTDRQTRELRRDAEPDRHANVLFETKREGQKHLDREPGKSKNKKIRHTTGRDGWHFRILDGPGVSVFVPFGPPDLRRAVYLCVFVSLPLQFCCHLSPCKHVPTLSRSSQGWYRAPSFNQQFAGSRQAFTPVVPLNERFENAYNTFHARITVHLLLGRT